MSTSSPVKRHIPEIHAVIGVWNRGDQTYYVKRSQKMQNYPGVWSLLSIRFNSHELERREDLAAVQEFMESMSRDRLGGVPLRVEKYLTSGDSDQNPYDMHVHLHLYEVALLRPPQLNPEFYSHGAWLTAEEYEAYSAGQSCGLCLRLWSDYAWLTGKTDRPFVSRMGAVP